MKKQTRTSLKYLIAFSSLFAFAIALININPFTEQDLVFNEVNVQQAKNNPAFDLQASGIPFISTTTNQAHDFTPRKVEEIFPAITTLMSSDLPDDYDEASRAAFIEQFMQNVDPKIEEIYQSLQAMEQIDFPEKETYKKVAKERIEQLEYLKANIN
jgi:hypothetical protein